MMDQKSLNIPLFQPADDDPCCGSPEAGPAGVHERAGYNICRFVDDFIDTDADPVALVATRVDWRDLAGGAMVRWGILRDDYRISPGLFGVGNPGQDSPVLVTANYKLTFDTLRCELGGQDVWILVLDTRGVNVWCASAHKTFGTTELVQRIKASNLAKVVSHRQLIVPQLGASGVNGQAVKSASGFEVVWGPIRAGDIPRFLANDQQADPAMRKLTFTLGERLVLAPVELAMAVKPVLLILAVMLVVSGVEPGFFSFKLAWFRWSFIVSAFLGGLLSGVVLVPALLPWLPFRSFYLKGIIMALPMAGAVVCWFGSPFWLESVAQALICLTVSSYLAMNFTGATPYASPSGVEKEMRFAIPVQIVMTLVAVVLWVANPFLR